MSSKRKCEERKVNDRTRFQQPKAPTEKESSFMNEGDQSTSSEAKNKTENVEQDQEEQEEEWDQVDVFLEEPSGLYDEANEEEVATEPSSSEIKRNA